MVDILLEPFTFAFMQRALLVAVLASAVASLVGTYVVVRGMAFLGGALSHAVLPGIAVAYIFGHNILAGAFFAGLVASLGIGFVSRHTQLKEDTAIGILMSGMFALGIAIISRIQSYTIDLVNFLFGNVLAASATDVWTTFCACLLVLAALWLLNRRWVILSFDPTYAAAIGLPTGLLHYGLMVLLSLVIVVAMRTVGVVLVLAMLVTPPATARLLFNRIQTIMWASALLGALAAVVGLYVSYYLNVASGAAIVLVSVTLFFVAFFFAPGKGFFPGKAAAHVE
jgi:ABC-type Mn2+/Zn2+ transport system permease subunit